MRLAHLYVIYRHCVGGRRVPLVVLHVKDFSAEQLSITCVHSVAKPTGREQACEADRIARVQNLRRKEYTSFGRACQHVYATVCGVERARTAHMNTFEVYVRGDLDSSLLGTTCERKAWHGDWVIERSSPMLASAHVETLAEPPLVPPDPPEARWEGWIAVGEGRPYAHISTPPQEVEAAVARMLQKARLARSRAPAPRQY